MACRTIRSHAAHGLVSGETVHTGALITSAATTV
jgi:hypothetical protein